MHIIRVQIVVLLAMLAIVCGCGEKDKPSETATLPARPDDDPQALFPATGGPLGERWGYIDRQGDVVVPAAFDEAYPFEDDYAAAHDDDELVILDRRGREVLRTPRRGEQMVPATQLHNGRLPVRRDGKWGCLDVNGRLVVPAVYDAPMSFHEGLAAVRTGDAFGYVDRDGKVVIEPHYTMAESFSEGLAAVRVGGRWEGRRLRGGKIGFINKDGEMVIEPAFAWTDGGFREGLAPMWQARRTSDGTWVFGGYIDRQGKWAIDAAAWSMGQPFSEGLAAVLDQATGRWGFIDRRGQTAVDCRFVRAWPFSDGLAAVKPARDNPDRRWGYINARGELAIPARYRMAGSFRDGLAPVTFADGDAAGYIDRAGRQVWPPTED
jgi:hypothetical protein